MPARPAEVRLVLLLDGVPKCHGHPIPHHPNALLSSSADVAVPPTLAASWTLPSVAARSAVS